MFDQRRSHARRKYADHQAPRGSSFPVAPRRPACTAQL